MERGSRHPRRDPSVHPGCSREVSAQVAKTHEPVAITGRRNNGVLISEEDWRAIQETLYLLSIAGMRESIREGLRTPLPKTSERAGW